MTEEVLVDFVRQLYLMPRTGGAPTYAAPMMARPGFRPYGDALTAARGGATQQPTYGYQQHPYGPTYAGGTYAAGAYPKVDSVGDAAPVRKVAAAPIKKRVLVRRIVRRKVVAPQVYSYSPSLPVAIQPAISVAPAPPVTMQAPAAGGYSAVPMPPQ